MTQNEIENYRASLKAARNRYERTKNQLREIETESRRLNEELRNLRRTITGLAALCSENPGMDRLGITDACMETMESVPTAVTTNEVVEFLDSMGFDIASQKNVSASVHAVLTRLAKEGKITKVTDATGAVYWRGPNYDAALDYAVKADSKQ